MAGMLSKLSITFFFLTMALYLALLSVIEFPLTTILKPIPIFFLLVITIQSSASTQTKVLLGAALVFSLLGDIVLTFPGEIALKIGILAFMLAHCVYIVLYIKDAQFQARRFVYFLPVFAFIGLGYSYLMPYLGKMTLPVTIYLGFLGLMVFSSFQVVQQPFLIISGACLFLLSDFIFALSEFVLTNNAITDFLIMLTYYIAQLLLVMGLSQRIPNKPTLVISSHFKRQWGP